MNGNHSGIIRQSHTFALYIYRQKPILQRDLKLLHPNQPMKVERLGW